MLDVWVVRVVSVLMIVNIVWCVWDVRVVWLWVTEALVWPDDCIPGSWMSWDRGWHLIFTSTLNSRREQLMEDGVRRTICLISLPSPWLLSVLRFWHYIRFHNIQRGFPLASSPGWLNLKLRQVSTWLTSGSVIGQERSLKPPKHSNVNGGTVFRTCACAW